MGALFTTLTVLFIIVCVILILIILLQSDKNSGMGIIGGSSQSTFGSSTADVITKITAVFVAIFMIGALLLAVLRSYTDENQLPDELETSSVEQTESSAE